MKFRNEEVVYIEYQDGKEFSVITGRDDKLWMSMFDFEKDCFDEERMMYHNSGSGGSAVEGIYVTGGETIWLHPKAKLIGGAENVIKLKEPIRHPFDGQREVFQTIYCKFCDCFRDENWCEHIVEGENDIEYYDGSSHE